MGAKPCRGDRIQAISLFSGLGGLDIGLHRAGIETLACVEKNEAAAETLRINSRHHDTDPAEEHITPLERFSWRVIEEDIRHVSAEDILTEAGAERGDIDLIVGGPPCQTFSRSNEGNRSGTDTKRGKLYEEYARILHEIRPMAFIFENVRGLESSNDGKDLRKVRDRLEGDYYESEYRVLNAADFGVPQTRKRIFIIGVSEGEPQFPEPTHSEEGANGKEEWVTVGQALEKFDIDQSIEEKGGYQNAIGSKYGKLLKDIPEGANYQHFSERRYDPEEDEYVDRGNQESYEKHFEWRSRHWNYLLKMDRNRPSWTLQAAPGSTVGPFHWRARKLSLLEQMELMTLPTDYYVAGLPGEIQSQVGNAVPPMLAEKVARTLALSLGLEPDLLDSTPGRTKSKNSVETDGQQPFTIEVTHDKSPWQHADRIIHTLLSTNAVVVRADGRDIPLALDALEIARRQSNIEFEIDIEEIVKEGDSWKGGMASVFQAKVLTEDATVEVTSSALAP